MPLDTLAEALSSRETRGTYGWKAEGYQAWWYLVPFKATDPYGGEDGAYLLIHILQPHGAYLLIHILQSPRVGDTEVWVRRGENLEHTLAKCL